MPLELNKRDKSAGITACCGQLDHMWKMLQSHCHALTEWRRKMDAMQKFLEYTSAYDEGSDYRMKLKISHTQRVTDEMELLKAELRLS